MQLYRIYLSLLFVTFFIPNILQAQGKNMGIGTATPHPSAILQLGDNDPQGLRIPYTDTNAVIAYANSFTPPIPIANGLLIYQKGAEAFYYYDAPQNKWVPLSGITGPTGPIGATGPTGPTGLTGFGSKVNYGSGPPVFQQGDTCGYYYIDVLQARVYRFSCPGGWFPITQNFRSKIFGGETISVHSTVNQTAPETSQNSTIMQPIQGLNYTVTAPFGYSAYIFVHAYGSVSKNQINNDYNYAKFDIYTGTPAIAANVWQVISMGPTGSAPENHQDLVQWSISYAANLGAGKRIEVYGAQQVRTKTGLGSLKIAGAPGTPEEAHMEIMVVFVRN